MRVALVATSSTGGRLQRLGDDGTPSGPPADVVDLAAAVADLETASPAEARPRWVLADAATAYPALAARGVRLGRSHDVALTEALLLGAEGDWRAPASLAAAWARHAGLPTPDGPPGASGGPGRSGSPWEPAEGQDALFGPVEDVTPLPGGVDGLQALVGVHAGQLRRVAAVREHSPGFGLLVAAESAAGLAAVEMGLAGLPWDAAAHDALLSELLGPRPQHGGRPARLQALAEQVASALGDPRLNVDSQVEVLRALRRAGLPVASTRRHEVRRHEHPAVEPLLRYKELARLHAAHGWAWRDQWVRGGRFHPEYVPAGVVSGRWATRGGGALQIPKAVRGAVVAPEGRILVVADAGQLEPRVLAAMSGDAGMIAATRDGDLYAALAREALGRPEARAEMKVALLSAMYGGGTGSPALAALRRRFPAALALLEDAARTGEAGRSVRSVLGRVAPPAEPGWLSGLGDDAAGARARARGRFTRNFVVQASAADWAGVLLAELRRLLAELAPAGRDGVPLDAVPRLVFFQHDEVVVEAPQGLGAEVVAAVTEAGARATRLVLGDVGVRVPLDAAAVRSYADKP